MTMRTNNCMQSAASAGYSTGSTIATMFGALLLLQPGDPLNIRTLDVQPIWLVATFTFCTGMMGVFLAIPMKRQMINFLVASITNDLGTEVGVPRLGTNRHEEQNVPAPYVGPMANTVLTIHWADDGIAGNFVPGGPNIGPESNTFAVNHDELVWYSYPTFGAFQVPAWDFGFIGLGQIVVRTLDFGIYAPVPVSSINPPSTNADLLIARTNDLKIGQYFQSDPIMMGIIDPGTPYPIGGFLPSTNDFANSSVFFIPTPGALALLLVGGAAAARRQRKA